MKNSSRLLEVRLRVSADVKILEEYFGATSMVYVSGIGYVCQLSGILTALQLHVKGLKKADLISEKQTRELSYQGTVQVLQGRVETFLKNLEKIYRGQNFDLTKVYLPQNIEPYCIANASDSILVSSSDKKKAICTITSEMDGVVKGNAIFFSRYPNGCEEVIYMCVNNNTLYVSHKGNPGGAAAINMSDSTVPHAAKEWNYALL